MSAPAAKPLTTTLYFGRRAHLRFWFLLLGCTALLTTLVSFILLFSGSKVFRGLAGIPYTLVAGVALMMWSHRIEGMSFDARQVRYWKYEDWFFGGMKTYSVDQIRHFALCYQDRTYRLKVFFKDGQEIEFPEEYVTARHAQIVMDRLCLHYGVKGIDAVVAREPEVEQEKLARARVWDAELWEVNSGSRQLEFTSHHGERWGNVVIGQRYSSHVEVEPQSFSTGWPIQLNSSAFDTITATYRETELQVKVSMGLITPLHYTMKWEDMKGVWWSAELFTKDSITHDQAVNPDSNWDDMLSDRSLRINMRLYRGLSEAVAGKEECEHIHAIQGPLSEVALIAGSPNRFKIYVFERDCGDWIRVALGLYWLRVAPTCTVRSKNYT